MTEKQRAAAESGIHTSTLPPKKRREFDNMTAAHPRHPVKNPRTSPEPCAPRPSPAQPAGPRVLPPAPPCPPRPPTTPPPRRIRRPIFGPPPLPPSDSSREPVVLSPIPLPGKLPAPPQRPLGRPCPESSPVTLVKSRTKREESRWTIRKERSRARRRRPEMPSLSPWAIPRVGRRKPPPKDLVKPGRSMTAK